MMSYRRMDTPSASANLRAATPAHALTGPVARGDARTVRSQLEALADRPRLLALYRALGTFLLDLVPERVRGEGHHEVARLLSPREAPRGHGKDAR